ncbi:MAG: hypothetical protein IPL46_02750 [Saprospiraceae bacterium]|nr:hypothetical protein [Saprospiraceae bacterium]
MKNLLIILVILLVIFGYCAYKGVQIVESVADTISQAPIESDIHSLIESYDFAGAREHLSDNTNKLDPGRSLELIAEIDSTEKNYLEFRSKNLEKAKVELKKLHVERDDFESTTWYRDKTSPRFTNVNGCYLYFGLDDEYKIERELRWAIQYVAADWIFTKKVGFNIDGERIDIEPHSLDRMVHDGGICEYFDQILGDDRSIVEKIISSDKATYRLYGSEGTIDKEITSKQKIAMKSVLDAYDLLAMK